MSYRAQYGQTYDQLKELINLWKEEATRLVKGPWDDRRKRHTTVTEWILARRTGRLSKSFRRIGPKISIQSMQHYGLSYYIKLLNYATDPETGFKYAAYHEYESGKRFIRPALLWLLDRRNPKNKLHGLGRAYVDDTTDLMVADLVRKGWHRGALPKTAVRTLKIDLGSGAGATESAIKPSLIPEKYFRDIK